MGLKCLVERISGYISTHESVIYTATGGWLNLSGCLANYQNSVGVCLGEGFKGDSLVTQDSFGRLFCLEF